MMLKQISGEVLMEWIKKSCEEQGISILIEKPAPIQLLRQL